MVSFRRCQKISSFLVKTKVYPIERTVGSFRYRSKRSEVCKYITETDTFSSSVTGETYTVMTNILCICLLGTNVKIIHWSNY